MAFKPTQAGGRDKIDVGSSSSPLIFFQPWENKLAQWAEWVRGLASPSSQL